AGLSGLRVDSIRFNRSKTRRGEVIRHTFGLSCRTGVKDENGGDGLRAPKEGGGGSPGRLQQWQRRIKYSRLPILRGLSSILSGKSRVDAVVAQARKPDLELPGRAYANIQMRVVCTLTRPFLSGKIKDSCCARE